MISLFSSAASTNLGTTIPNSEEDITSTLDTSNVNILSEEEFQRYSILRDQELETHFQHLKIETAEE